MLFEHVENISTITRTTYVQFDGKRHIIFNTAAYLVRHRGLTEQRVDDLPSLQRNEVTSPLGAINGQNRAKDKLCVRQSSI
jgi:hypothetical protein